MELGDAIRNAIGRSLQRQQLARDWLSLGGSDAPLETVVANLARLLENEPQGIRFFFGDPKSGRLLLELAGVPPEQHPALLKGAQEALAETGRPQAALVIDASPWGRGRNTAALLEALERRLLASRLSPAWLVVTEAQAQRLLRPPAGCEVLRVATSEEGYRRARELAGGRALVASPRPNRPYERWLALAWDGTTLRLDPEDGPERFAADGVLDALPEVAHPLEVLRVPPHGVLPRMDAVQARRMMRTLADESQAGSLGPASRRLAYAQALRVRATSLPSERQEHAGAAQAAARATRLATGAEALAEGHGDGAEPALARLLAVADARTEDDWLEDPLLDAAVERLACGPQDRLMLEFAAATILRSGCCKPAPDTPVRDWAEALRALVADDPEQVWLWGRLGAVLESRPKSRVWGRPAVHCILTQRDRAVLVTPSSVRYEHNSSWDGTVALPLGWITPLDPRLARDLDIFHNLAGLSLSGGGERPRIKAALSGPLVELELDGRKLTIPDTLACDPLTHGKDLYIPRSEDWRRAELDAGQAFLALRRALSSAEGMRLPDGTVLLRLGGPFAALVQVRQRTGGRRAVVVAPRNAAFRPGPFADFFLPSMRTTALYDAEALPLPLGLYLSCPGYAADITFGKLTLLAAGWSGAQTEAGAVARRRTADARPAVADANAPKWLPPPDDR